jgi:hypothetical protein
MICDWLKDGLLIVMFYVLVYLLCGFVTFPEDPGR